MINVDLFEKWTKYKIKFLLIFIPFMQHFLFLKALKNKNAKRCDQNKMLKTLDWYFRTWLLNTGDHRQAGVIWLDQTLTSPTHQPVFQLLDIVPHTTSTAWTPLSVLLPLHSRKQGFTLLRLLPKLLRNLHDFSAGADLLLTTCTFMAYI